MFDKLEDLLIRYEEIMSELSEPDVANNPERFRKLMKEQSSLTPIVEAYKEYKQCKQNIEDSLAMLEEESDEEMREMAKEELNDSKARVEELESQMKILLLPKDPNDDKNVIVEIRAVRAAMRQRSLRRKFIECMCTLQRADAGRWSWWSVRRLASAE